MGGGTGWGIGGEGGGSGHGNPSAKDTRQVSCSQLYKPRSAILNYDNAYPSSEGTQMV